MNTGIHVISLPAFTLTGMQLLATPMSPAIVQLWGSFVVDMPRIQERTEPNVTYGGMRNYDTTTQTFEYLAGVAVSADTTPLSGQPQLESTSIGICNKSRHHCHHWPSHGPHSSVDSRIRVCPR